MQTAHHGLYLTVTTQKDNYGLNIPMGLNARLRNCGGHLMMKTQEAICMKPSTPGSSASTA
eukprot:5167698-Amphidinium_carterae.1